MALCFGACKGGEPSQPAAPEAAGPTPSAAPSPTPLPTPSPSPSPSPTPTPVPTPTPAPVYQDITEADYETLFNEAVTKERLGYILQYLPVGSCKEGLSAIAAKNVWEAFNMTDNMAITKLYDIHFEDNAQTVTGDASQMFAWLGIVNNKGIHNDPADDSVVIDGNILTIDNRRAVHADRLNPKISMGKRSETDLYLYYSYSTEFHSAGPNVFRTAVFQKDETGKYQVVEIVEREGGSTAPAKPEYQFSFLTDQEKESGDIWESLLSSGAFYEYVPQWPMAEVPAQYAVLDIDGDGATELVLSSDTDGTGFATFAVMVFDPETETIRPVKFPGVTGRELSYAMCHNGLRYSEAYHALVYKPMNNGSMFGSFEYHTLQNKQDSLLFCVSYGTLAGSSELSYTCGLGEDAEMITQEEYQAFLAEAANVEFQPFAYG